MRSAEKLRDPAKIPYCPPEPLLRSDGAVQPATVADELVGDGSVREKFRDHGAGLLGIAEQDPHRHGGVVGVQILLVGACERRTEFLVLHASARHLADLGAEAHGERQPEHGRLRLGVALEETVTVGFPARVRPGIGLLPALLAGTAPLSQDLQPGDEPRGEERRQTSDERDQRGVGHVLMMGARSARHHLIGHTSSSRRRASSRR
nr:hypothetical protein GCM10010200_018840 [Actinomadura rugatobispora]